MKFNINYSKSIETQKIDLMGVFKTTNLITNGKKGTSFKKNKIFAFVILFKALSLYL